MKAHSGRRIHLVAIVFAMVYLGALWRLDFPKPQYDDLFFCGAAVNLAQDGGFCNPLLDRQGFPSHYYFVHPPHYSFALAGWLKLFGVSAAAVTGFQAAMCLVISVATMHLLRRLQAPRFLLFLVPLGASAGFLPEGMRHDSLAVALVMTGLALAWDHPPGGLTGLVAFGLLFTGGAVAPLYAVYQAWGKLEAAPAKAGFIGSVFLAFLASILLFAWLIDFRVVEFWQTFHVCMQRIEGSKLHALATFLFSGFSQCPLLLLLLPLGVPAMRERPTPIVYLCAAIFLAFPVVTLIGGIGPGAMWYATLLAFLLLVNAFRTAPGWRRSLLAPALGFALLVANGKLFAQAGGIIGGQVAMHDAGENHPAVQALAFDPKETKLIDGSVARYLFDYRLPPGCLDIEYAAPFPDGFPTYSQLRAGEVVLVGPQTLEYLAGHGYPAGGQAPKWKVPGFSRWAFYVRPAEVFVIHPKSN